MSNLINGTTLLLGNGFLRSLFSDFPSWGDLFKNALGNKDNDEPMNTDNNKTEKDKQDSKFSNYTILYEIERLSGTNRFAAEDVVKRVLIKELEEKVSAKFKQSQRILDDFGNQLVVHNVNNIITTNYDRCIEMVLTDNCGYIETAPKDMAAETIYCMRTYKVFVNKEANHTVKLWHIHGDVDRIKSITLGFDQYCGQLNKIVSYVKGSYNSSKSAKNGVVVKTSIKDKCEQDSFDGISWVELFFNSNIYIVGLGLDFSEIDIWWLFNKRARLMLETQSITNNIYFLFNNKYENKVLKPFLFKALDAFGVRYKAIPNDNDSDYLTSVFDLIE